MSDLTVESLTKDMNAIMDEFPIYTSVKMNVRSSEIVKAAFDGVAPLDGGAYFASSFEGIVIYIDESIPDNIIRFIASHGTEKDVSL